MSFRAVPRCFLIIRAVCLSMSWVPDMISPHIHVRIPSRCLICVYVVTMFCFEVCMSQLLLLATWELHVLKPARQLMLDHARLGRLVLAPWCKCVFRQGTSSTLLCADMLPLASCQSGFHDLPNGCGRYAVMPLLSNKKENRISISSRTMFSCRNERFFNAYTQPRSFRRQSHFNKMLFLTPRAKSAHSRKSPFFGRGGDDSRAQAAARLFHTSV